MEMDKDSKWHLPKAAASEDPPDSASSLDLDAFRLVEPEIQSVTSTLLALYTFKDAQPQLTQRAQILRWNQPITYAMRVVLKRNDHSRKPIFKYPQERDNNKAQFL